MVGCVVVVVIVVVEVAIAVVNCILDMIRLQWLKMIVFLILAVIMTAAVKAAAAQQMDIWHTMRSE